METVKPLLSNKSAWQNNYAIPRLTFIMFLSLAAFSYHITESNMQTQYLVYRTGFWPLILPQHFVAFLPSDGWLWRGLWLALNDNFLALGNNYCFLHLIEWESGSWSCCKRKCINSTENNQNFLFHYVLIED